MAVDASGARIAAGMYSGALYRARSLPSGPELILSGSSEMAFVGNATLTFSDPDNGMFAYEINGVRQTKPITRQSFASPVPTCISGAAMPASTNFQDLWWGSPPGSEPGWGVQIAHQGDILFATIFGYERSGKGVWLVMSDGRRVGPHTYSGVLYRTRGPSFGVEPWRTDAVSASAVGRGTFTFSDVYSGSFSYTLDDLPSTEERKSITRQVFAPYATSCN